jgi:hypothetical protein
MKGGNRNEVRDSRRKRCEATETRLRTGAMETVPRRTRAPPTGAERQCVGRFLLEKGKGND